jgi:hypothetical protein
MSVVEELMVRSGRLFALLLSSGAAATAVAQSPATAADSAAEYAVADQVFDEFRRRRASR